ncbi:Uncharacterized protein GBIM_07575 [Gryllus bimaculatus]|nr:Uncharacterized protein GBIM_07575 [Gryllus bimaculatus]
MKSDNSTEVARKQRDWTQLKRALGHIGLLIALTAYTVLGGQVFSKLEGPDEAARLGPLHDAAVARRRELLGALANLSASDPPAAARVERALAAYEDELQSAVGGGVALPFVVSGQRPPTRWNLTQAVFFATTVLTTIGECSHTPPALSPTKGKKETFSPQM